MPVVTSAAHGKLPQIDGGSRTTTLLAAESEFREAQPSLSPPPPSILFSHPFRLRFHKTRDAAR